jgi:hypothetical protein
MSAARTALGFGRAGAALYNGVEDFPVALYLAFQVGQTLFE